VFVVSVSEIRFTNHCNGAENWSLLTDVLAPGIAFTICCTGFGNRICYLLYAFGESGLTLHGRRRNLTVSQPAPTICRMAQVACFCVKGFANV
jgi:hypothetical protein